MAFIVWSVNQRKYRFEHVKHNAPRIRLLVDETKDKGRLIQWHSQFRPYHALGYEGVCCKRLIIAFILDSNNIVTGLQINVQSMFKLAFDQPT